MKYGAVSYAGILFPRMADMRCSQCKAPVNAANPAWRNNGTNWEHYCPTSRCVPQYFPAEPVPTDEAGPCPCDLNPASHEAKLGQLLKRLNAINTPPANSGRAAYSADARAALQDAYLELQEIAREAQGLRLAADTCRHQMAAMATELLDMGNTAQGWVAFLKESPRGMAAYQDWCQQHKLDALIREEGNG